MKTRILLIITIAAGIIVAASAVWAAEQPAIPSSGGWQHLALNAGTSTKDSDLARKINELGRKGWELVTVTPISKNGTTGTLIYFFKKPLS